MAVLNLALWALTQPSSVLYQLKIQRRLAVLTLALWALTQPSLVLHQWSRR